jgi:transposase-like protein
MAKRFFRQALENHATPRVITLDAYAASHRAIKVPGRPRAAPDIRAAVLAA